MLPVLSHFTMYFRQTASFTAAARNVLPSARTGRSWSWRTAIWKKGGKSGSLRTMTPTKNYEESSNNNLHICFVNIFLKCLFVPMFFYNGGKMTFGCLCTYNSHHPPLGVTRPPVCASVWASSASFCPGRRRASVGPLLYHII